MADKVIKLEKGLGAAARQTLDDANRAFDYASATSTPAVSLRDGPPPLSASVGPPKSTIRRSIDPRGTDSKEVERRANNDRGIRNKQSGEDANKELLLQLGLDPAAAPKSNRLPEIALSLDDYARGAATRRVPPPPPPSKRQREEAEVSEATRLREIKPKTTTERIAQAEIQQGVPENIVRQLSDFEVRLRTDKNVRLIDPTRGIPTGAFGSRDFLPLADPDTGAIIGYYKAGADHLIADIRGNIVEWSENPIEPSAIQPDDVVELAIGVGELTVVGKELVKIGGRRAAPLLAAAGRYVSKRTTRQLRNVTAALAVGLSKAAPVLANELGPRAAIIAEKEAATVVGEASTILGREAALVGEEAEKVTESIVRAPIAGAAEVRLAEAEYEAALKHVFPSHFLNPITRMVEGIGQRAASRAIDNPRFIQAVQQRNWTLAGTLFHSAAAAVAGALPASALPPGWKLEAERTLQSGLGGSRADVLLQGPSNEVVEFDWKTSGRSALSTSSRNEMIRHAGHIATNIGGTLTVQESRAWIDFVREVRPDLFN
jgi:hypothetical protein